MNKRYTISKILVVFSIFFYLILLTDTIAHENAHKQIARNNVGCKEWDIKINYLTLAGSFNCTEQMEDFPIEFYQQKALLDSWNEIVSYNMATIATSIMGVGLIISLAVILK